MRTGRITPSTSNERHPHLRAIHQATGTASRIGAVSGFLLSRADQQLVDGHAPRARHDVLNGLGDVLGREELKAGIALLQLLAHLFPNMACQLSRRSLARPPRHARAGLSPPGPVTRS